MTEKNTISFGEAVTGFKECLKILGEDIIEKYPLYKDFYDMYTKILDENNAHERDTYRDQEFVSDADYIKGAYKALDHAATIASRNGELPDDADKVLQKYQVPDIATGDISICEPNFTETAQNIGKWNEGGRENIKNAFNVQMNILVLDINQLRQDFQSALKL